MPRRRALRMIREAISPRLAIKIFLNVPLRRAGMASERNVVVLLPRVLERFRAQHRESPADASASGMRHDHVVDESAMTGDERIGELVAVLLGAGLDLGLIPDVAAEYDLDRALRPHDRDLC